MLYLYFVNKTQNKKIEIMKARVEITKEAAQRVMNTQYQSNLIEDVFETGLECLESDEEKLEMIEKLEDKTEWSIVFETDTEDNIISAELDWKNNIIGFGTCFWGHSPIKLLLDGTHHRHIFQIIKEGAYYEIAE